MNIPFLVLNGLIAFFSDIFLNILSHYNTGNIKTLINRYNPDTLSETGEDAEYTSYSKKF